ncbi:MAG: S66 peptidase family protein [Cyanobacteria bacterium P01_A01_bin.83]
MNNKISYPKVDPSRLSIGLTAPSSGLGSQLLIRRYEEVAQQHVRKGIPIKEGRMLRENTLYVSGTAQERADDFMKLWKDSEISLIQPPWGGEFAIDILSLLDYSIIKSSPKWVMGYSDISTLLFAITVITGVATAHGTNFMDSIEGQDRLTARSRDFLQCAAGETLTQESSEKWQNEFVDFTAGTGVTFDLKEPTIWKILQGRDECTINGRIIGGCLDTLVHLRGTSYGDLQKFSNVYAKKEGILLYLENCEQPPNEIYRSLWAMKYSGWFENVNGVIWGRNNRSDEGEFSYLECLKSFFTQFNFPVVFDADIGHKSPQMTIINGAYATLRVKGGKAILEQHFV